MSIKIIKSGRSEYERQFLAICQRCDAQFLCNRRDGNFVQRPVLRPYEGGYVSVNCPNCGRGCTAYPYQKEEYESSE